MFLAELHIRLIRYQPKISLDDIRTIPMNHRPANNDFNGNGAVASVTGATAISSGICTIGVTAATGSIGTSLVYSGNIGDGTITFPGPGAAGKTARGTFGEYNQINGKSTTTCIAANHIA